MTGDSPTFVALFDFANDGSVDPLLFAITLAVLGIVLLVAEIFVVSFGVLLLGATACLVGAIYFAFAAGDVAGWTFTVAVPILSIVVLTWGLRRLRRSRLVPQAEITADAGYRHVTQRIGVDIGSIGIMVTPGRPSGRARFDGGECDVQVRGSALEPDARVIVKQIDGPAVVVVPYNDVLSSGKASADSQTK